MALMNGSVHIIDQRETVDQNVDRVRSLQDSLQSDTSIEQGSSASNATAKSILIDTAQ